MFKTCLFKVSVMYSSEQIYLPMLDFSEEEENIFGLSSFLIIAILV